MINFFLSISKPIITPPEPSVDTIMLDESFSSVPSGWVNNGFTVNNGLEASGTGGMGTNIIYNSDSFLDRQTVKVEFLVNDLTSAFGVGKDLAFRGNLAKADFNANTLQLGIITSQGVEPTYEFSTTLTNITKTIGHIYVLEFTKDRQKTSCKIYDKASPTIYDEIVMDYDLDITFAGSAWGSPIAYFFSGDIKISNFQYIALSPSAPKIAMYGDSITEGFTLIDQSGNLKSRWSDKLYVVNNGNAYISAQGGINTAGTLAYIDFEQLYLIPTYTILFLGANDTVFATWQSNIDALIAKVNAIGSTPVIATILPRSDRQTFINLANDYILNTLSLSYDIIDFAAAVTDNRDRLTWTSGYLLPDNVHPTVSGHLAMYNEIVNNNNYLT